MNIASGALEFVTFNRDNQRLFDGYLKIKYEVFVEEMGWDKIPHSKTDRTALEDPYDADSTFCATVDAPDKMAGVVRGTLPKRLRDMYRAELYTSFANLGFVTALDGRVATVNAMAVAPQYRWARLAPCAASAPLRKRRVAVSDMLMKHIMTQLQSMGAAVIVLSAIRGPAYALMKRVGFKTFSPPHVFRPADYSSNPYAPDLMVFDLAAIIGDVLAPAFESNRVDDPAEGPALRKLRTFLNTSDAIHHSQYDAQ
jgi:hypothetical protein